MTDDDLLRVIQSEEERAIGYMGGDLSTEREQAIQYYQGNLDVKAPEGRSDVVSTDVRDAVDGMLPDLLDVFLSSDEAVKFDPQGPEDEQAAKQQTDVANYVFYRQNNGALILYEWFKTALLEKNSIVKFWWDTNPTVTEETYQGLAPEQVQMLSQSPGIVIAGAQQRPDGLFDVMLRNTKPEGKICISGIPPEEFLISARHNSVSLDMCPFMAHRAKRTASDLAILGIDPSDLPAGDDSGGSDFMPEWTARRRLNEERDYGHGSNADPSMREYWTTEANMLVDFNGDGIAELRRVLKVGGRIFKNELIKGRDYAAICPIIMPYRFYGLSIADVVLDIQKLKSIIWRQSLDSLYLANNPRIGVMESMTNLDDLLVSRPGGIVRFKTNPSMAMAPIETRFVGQQAFPMIEYMDAVKENRTGFTRYSQGLDADSLNKTATGISLISNAAAKRLKLIARMFAETGVKDLFRGIVRLMSEYNTKPMTLRLRNQWVNVDPRQWNTEYDMTINVGLGTNDRNQQAQQLQAVMGVQDALRKSGMGHLVSDSNMYNAAAKMAEAVGFKSAEVFFTPPGPDNPMPQSGPPPEIVKIQTEADIEKAKIESNERQKMAEVQNGQSVTRMQSETNIMVARIKQETDLAIAKLRETSAAELAIFKARESAKDSARQQPQ